MKLKRIMALVLCFVMVLSTMSFNVFAEESVTETTDTVVAEVGDAEFTDIQEAIKEAAPNGTVDIVDDIVVDEWVMIAESLTISGDTLITLEIDGLTINGNGKTLTINSIESAGNGGYLFYDASNLTIENLTIKYADGLVGGIGLKAGTISGVTFDGGVYGVMPQTGDVTITGCTFKTNGTAIYFEEDRDGLVVDNNTFDVADGEYSIILRGDADFTNNTVLSGKVNLANSASGAISGNDFGDNRFKVYNAATANIENNEINVLVFNDDSEIKSTFGENTYSEDAEDVLKDAGVLPDDNTSEGGSGTEEDPILINTAEDLIALRDAVNSGDNYAGKYVMLNDDIDLSSVSNWTPIGDVLYNSNYAPADTTKVFSGTFDGNDKVISNLKIEKFLNDAEEGPDADANLGLFGIIGEGAVIKDLTITNVDITTDGRNVGALAGVAYKATLDNITVNGDIQITGGNNVCGVCAMTRYYDVSATNITVSGEEGSYINGNNIVAGMFAEIAPNGSNQTFENLSVENVAINGVGGVGGIVGLLTNGSVSNVSVKNVELVGNTAWPAGGEDRIRIGSIAGLLGSNNATISGVTVENVTAKNLDDEDVVLPVVGANYGASSNATEAKIGDTYYATLAKAFAAAVEGDTVTLLCDIENVIEIPDGVTLETNGYRFGDNLTGIGTKEDPYLINNIDDLVWFRNDVNAGNTYEGKYVKLTADIDLEGYQEANISGNFESTFRPIGDSGCSASFNGTFDGGDHTISNLSQSGWDLGYEWGSYGSLGLFGIIDGATVENLTVKDFELVVEGGDVAAISGSAKGTCVFRNINVEGCICATYNNGCGSIVAWSGAGNYTFENIKIDDEVVLAGLWGSFDSSIGGVVGQAEPGATYTLKNVDIACRLDVYNDSTASYDYYNYRMCGMIIGRLQKTISVDGRNYPDMSAYNITCEDVNVTIGEWANYHYCEPTPGYNNGRGMRVEPGYAYDGLPADYDHSQCTTNHMALMQFEQLFGGDQLGVDGADKTILEKQGFDTSTLTVVDLAKTADCVAKIGDDGFETLSAAITAAQPDDTIKLLRDITVVGETYTIPDGKSVILDMNGKTITATDNKASNVNYEIFYNYGNLTVTGNGTIELTSTSNDTAWAKASSIFHNRGGVLIIENGTFTHKGGTAMAYVVDNSGNSYGDATTIVNDGTLKSAYIVIRNRMDTYAANGGGNGIPTLDINGGYYEGKYAIWGQVASKGVKGNIDISKGIFIAAEGKDAVLVDGDDTGEIVTAISGGTFSSDVSAYVVKDYKISETTDGFYVVYPEFVVEAIADVATAVAGETITVEVKVTKGGNYTNADWVLKYDPRYVTYTGNDDKNYKISGRKTDGDTDDGNDEFDENTVLGRYTFTVNEDVTTGTAVFEIVSAEVHNYAMAIEFDGVAASTKEDRVIIGLKESSGTISDKEVIYNGAEQRGNEVIDAPEGARVTYSYTTDFSNGINIPPSFINAGEYTYYAKIEVDGYETETVEGKLEIKAKEVNPSVEWSVAPESDRVLYIPVIRGVLDDTYKGTVTVINGTDDQGNDIVIETLDASDFAYDGHGRAVYTGDELEISGVASGQLTLDIKYTAGTADNYATSEGEASVDVDKSTIDEATENLLERAIIGAGNIIYDGQTHYVDINGDTLPDDWTATVSPQNGVRVFGDIEVVDVTFTDTTGKYNDYTATVMIKTVRREVTIYVNNATKKNGEADKDAIGWGYTATTSNGVGDDIIGDDLGEIKIVRANGETGEVEGTYTITATYTPNDNYDVAPVENGTLIIFDAVIKIEVVDNAHNGNELKYQDVKSDYTAGSPANGNVATKMILVHTDADYAFFTYKGEKMYDVTDAEYSFVDHNYTEGRHTTDKKYQHVYAIVVDAEYGDVTSEAIEGKYASHIAYAGKDETAAYAPVKVTYDADINNKDALHTNDYSTVKGVYGGVYNNIQYQISILKADYTKDKIVNTADAIAVKNVVIGE